MTDTQLSLEDLLKGNGSSADTTFVEAARRVIAEKTSRQREKAQKRQEAEALRAQMWKESAKNHQREQQEALRYQWISYHRAQIENHRKTRDELISRHEAALEQLEKGA